MIQGCAESGLALASSHHSIHSHFLAQFWRPSYPVIGPMSNASQFLKTVANWRLLERAANWQFLDGTDELERLLGKPPRPLSLTATVEERLVLPTYSSRWEAAAVAAHRCLSLPFQLLGRARRRSLEFQGEMTVIVEIGREKLIRPLTSRLFGELPAAVLVQLRSVWSPSALPEAASGDVVIAEVHRWMAERFRRAGWLIVPQAVRWHGDLATILSSPGFRESLANARKQGFRIEQTASAADWDYFYSEMLEPQASAPHSSVWLPSSRLLAELAHAGSLHLITRGGERVAGVCTVPLRESLWLAVSAVRQGHPALIQQGVDFALFALIIEWARAQGYHRIDAGRTSPFLKDGLQQFNRMWGLVPAVDPLSHVAAIWVGSAVVQRAFALQPAMVEDGLGLRSYVGE
jgi:hypothetical protein